MSEITKDQIYLVTCREVFKGGWGKEHHVIVCAKNTDRIKIVIEAGMPSYQYIAATPLVQFEEVVKRILAALQGKDPEWKVLSDLTLV